MYFCNRFTASFKPEGDSPERSQTFYIKKNAGITAKEAYNLLNGRFVNKDLIAKTANRTMRGCRSTSTKRMKLAITRSG